MYKQTFRRSDISREHSKRERADWELQSGNGGMYMCICVTLYRLISFTFDVLVLYSLRLPVLNGRLPVVEASE